MRAVRVRGEWAPRDGYALQAEEERTRVARTGSMVWRSPQFAVEQVPEPEIAPDEVLIRVRACGICGSDVHVYERDADGYMLYPGMIGLPVVTGHEFAGEVAAVGVGVIGLAVGDPVCAEEIAWCGECVACRSGRLNSCEHLAELGFTYDGAHAELVAVKAKYCWPIAALVDRLGEERGYAAGALVEPTSVAYIGMFVQTRRFLPGSSVGVVGAGPIGLAAVGLARAAGAAAIVCFEPSQVRRGLALEVGADAAHDPREVTLAEVALEAGGGRGLDLWVEASGAPGVVEQLSSALAPGADVVLLGRGTHHLALNPERLIVRGAALVGSIGHSGSGAFGRVIALMASGRLDMARIVTERVGIEQAIDRLGELGSRDTGKVLVVP